MTIVKYSFGVLAVLIMISSCKSDSTKKVTEKAPPVEAEQPVTIQKIDRKNYSIEIPASLTENASLNPEASLSYMSEKDNQFVLVIDEPRADVLKTMKEAGEYDNNLSFIENFSRKRIELFMEGMSLNYPAVKGSINSKSGQLVTYQAEGKRSDVPYDITTYFAFAEGKENCYAVMAWTIKDSAKEYETAVDEIFKSIDIKK